MSNTIDFDKMTDKELADFKKNIEDVEKKRLNEEIIEERKQAKINNLRFFKHKDILFDLLQHDCRSCSDNYIHNGFHLTDYKTYEYDCAKCALMEILEDENYCIMEDYEISLSVNITPTRKLKE